MRNSNRSNEDIRKLVITPDYVRNLPGAVLVELGLTRVVVTATVNDRVPPFLRDSKKGWINAEYSMLPGSVGQPRLQRERQRYHGRHLEIQRFLSRALRNTFDLEAIEGVTITIDADVIQADGSTRCASLIGGMITLKKALGHLVYEQMIAEMPEIEVISAVSLGLRREEILVDIDYQEDSSVDADINLVSSERGNMVEVQGFAEEQPVDAGLFKRALDLGVEKNLEIIEQMQPLLRY